MSYILRMKVLLMNLVFLCTNIYDSPNPMLLSIKDHNVQSERLARVNY